MPDYFPFDRIRAGRRGRALPGTIDSQFHVLGPADRYPVRAGAAYEMPSATWEAARRMHQALGISRGIVVQTTTYGADHRVVLDGLAALGPGYKGCANALVFESASDAELERLHAAGVRGARFSFRQALGAVLSREAFDRAVGKLRELGWYMKIQPEQNGIVESLPWFEHLELPILIDHMGRPRRLGRARSRPQRRQAAPAPAARQLLGDAVARREESRRRARRTTTSCRSARALIDAAPERCVWGVGLAASGVEEAAAQRRRSARAAVPLRAQRGRAAPHPGRQSEQAVRLRELMDCFTEIRP